MILQQAFYWLVGYLSYLYAQIGAVFTQHFFKIIGDRADEVCWYGLVVLVAADMCIEKIIHTLVHHILNVLFATML